MTIVQRYFSRLRGQRGSIMLVFALTFVVLLATMGLVLDLGRAYMAKASLSKAADAAALAAIHSYNGANLADAEEVARDIFRANYGSAPDGLEINISTAGGIRTAEVIAPTMMQTSLVRLLPGLNNVAVQSIGTAVRTPLYMTLVLDKSGSMIGNGGCAAMRNSTGGGAVPDFLDNFDDSYDSAGLVTFATTAIPELAPMQQDFKDAIDSEIDDYFPNNCDERTNAAGGLVDAQTIFNNAVLPPQTAKIVIFFTDGWPNKYPCNTDPSGACDSGEADTDPAAMAAKAVASNMRQSGITIYSVGLGNDLSPAFLESVANATTTGAAIDPNQPAGLTVLAPSAAQLDEAFQRIADTILYRLAR